MERLAKITKASLGFSDRRILMLHILVDYEDGWSQNICGYCLDGKPEKSGGDRIGTAYGCEMIRKFLDTLGIDDIHEANGKLILVVGEDSGSMLNFKTHGFKTLKVNGPQKEMDFLKIAEKFGIQ